MNKLIESLNTEPKCQNLMSRTNRLAMFLNALALAPLKIAYSDLAIALEYRSKKAAVEFIKRAEKAGVIEVDRSSQPNSYSLTNNKETLSEYEHLIVDVDKLIPYLIE